MLKVAMLSRWHVHASGYANAFREAPDAEVTCVWDEDPARGAAWAKELGVPFVEDVDALLARPDVDAVAICSPTNLHRDLMLRAARAGKHIFTEKVMCLTVRDCDEVAEAVARAGVTFTISFPQRCLGRNLFIKRALDEGLLGEATLVRVRNCHSGALAGWLPDYWYDPETTGGGAMMDLGAHPMYLARWLLGAPRRVQSMFTDRTGHAVEDNAVCLIEFASGAIAVSETSLVSPHTPALLEVYGTRGALLAEDNRVRFRTDSLRASGGEGGWIEPALPDDLPSPLRQFIDSARCGKPVRFGLAEGRELTELMEAAYRAHRAGGQVAL